MLRQPVIRNPWSQAGIMDPWLGYMIVVYWARLGQTVGWGRRLELEMLGGYLTGLNRVLRVRRLAAMAAWLCTFVWNKHCCHQRSPEVPWKPMQLKTPKVTHQWGWSWPKMIRWNQNAKFFDAFLLTAGCNYGFSSTDLLSGKPAAFFGRSTTIGKARDFLKSLISLPWTFEFCQPLYMPMSNWRFEVLLATPKLLHWHFSD